MRDELGGLPSPEQAEGIWRGIWLEEAHHSTAIEGNTLVLKQVAQLLQEGRAVGDKELSEYLEVRGYADAANWVYGHGMRPGDWGGEELLTRAELREVHGLAMGPVWDVALLVRLGYPPAIIYKSDRARYLAALRRANDGDSGPLGEFLARAILDNLYKFVVPAVAGRERLVPLPSLATKEVAANALRVAAVRGRLKAVKVADGSWRSTTAWVQEYVTSRYRREGEGR